MMPFFLLLLLQFVKYGRLLFSLSFQGYYHYNYSYSVSAHQRRLHTYMCAADYKSLHSVQMSSSNKRTNIKVWSRAAGGQKQWLSFIKKQKEKKTTQYMPCHTHIYMLDQTGYNHLYRLNINKYILCIFI
jgi:hypothetical protein